MCRLPVLLVLGEAEEGEAPTIVARASSTNQEIVPRRSRTRKPAEARRQAEVGRLMRPAEVGGLARDGKVGASSMMPLGSGRPWTPEAAD